MQKPKTEQDYTFVEECLYDAGKAFMRLSAHGTRPHLRTTPLFEFLVHCVHEAYNYNHPTPPRQYNTTKQTSHMEQMEEFALMIPETHVRRVILMRMLTKPESDRPIYSWRAIARRLKCNDKTAKTWWKKGVKQIAEYMEKK
jgi:hypothetical protein